MALFRTLATETAAGLGHAYPAGADRAIAGYVAHLREVAAADRPTAGVVVRRARSDDHAAVRALQDELDREHAAALPDVLTGPDPEDDDFAEAVANEARCFMAVAEEGGEVVGFVDASWHDPETPTDLVRPWCRINNLAVRAEHRRRGAATALVRAAEAWTRARGLPDVRLDVYEFNASARRLYERLGYATYRRQMRRQLGT
jgi:ribosomal protein S18 acetylase RimI-like enzyme